MEGIWTGEDGKGQLEYWRKDCRKMGGKVPYAGSKKDLHGGEEAAGGQDGLTNQRGR
jgi:hypothetical protein